MAAANLPPLQYAMQSDADLENKLCEKGLKVLEVYSDWCGPCKSVLPTFRRIKLDKDDETTLQFLTGEKPDPFEATCAVTTGLYPDAKSIYCFPVAPELEHFVEPRRVLLQNGNLKHKVQGADTPLLSSQVLQLTPITADTDDLAENGTLKARTLRLKVIAG